MYYNGYLRNTENTSWGKELKHSISTIAELEQYIDLQPEEKEQLKEVIEMHPMLITRYYMSLIDRGNPDDPIRKLIVPSVEELNLEGSYDTSGEKESTVLFGLQHKYKPDALILSTNRCSAYCRHCFRKRMVGLSTEEILQHFNEAADYIEKHEEINNVLISGGDPFVLPTSMIKKFLERLSDIDHIDFIRFGSRIPVAFPDRIINDRSLLDLLEDYSYNHKRIYVVNHYNHPVELSEKSIEAVNYLIQAGVILNNQTVLLKGVNDDPDIMAELQNRLVRNGINPYYIFQCRPVKRVKNHFQVPLKRGYEILEEAKKQMNGHSKRFKFIMSHYTGKIEILGIIDDEIYLKYHQARNPEDLGKTFKKKLNPDAGWLDDLD